MQSYLKYLGSSLTPIQVDGKKDWFHFSKNWVQNRKYSCISAKTKARAICQTATFHHVRSIPHACLNNTAYWWTQKPFSQEQHHTSPILSSSSLLPDPSQLLKVLPPFFSIYFPYNYCPIYTGLAMKLAKSFPFVLRTRCDFFLCRSFLQVKYWQS